MSQSIYVIRLVDIWHCWNRDTKESWLDVVPKNSNYLIEYSLSLFKLGWMGTIVDIDKDIHESTSSIRQHLNTTNATTAVGARLWFTSDQKKLLVEQHPPLANYFVLEQ